MFSGPPKCGEMLTHKPRRAIVLCSEIWRQIPADVCVGFVLLSSQFNCTYRKSQESSETVPRIVPGPGRQPVNNMTFNMELYSTLPFHNPSRQTFYTVSQNQQVFVEVCFAFLIHCLHYVAYMSCLFCSLMWYCLMQWVFLSLNESLSEKTVLCVHSVWDFSFLL